MITYANESNISLAVDCLIFGYDQHALKLLLMKKGIAPPSDKWSLTGGFVNINESIDQTSARILKQLTGLEKVYLEQLHVFGDIYRNPGKRTVSIAYFALVDINEYRDQRSGDYQAVWFPLKKLPKLIFDQQEMVELAKERIRYKAARQPLLFELLPTKFTMPQIQNLYETVYNISIDSRNFSRRLHATGLLVKLDDKDNHSKKGAHYYQLHTQNYYMKFQRPFNLVPSLDNLI